MESRLPKGTVTFLMTDIEGSTRLWEETPKVMEAAIRRHDEIADEVISRAGGVIIKSRGEGDSLFVVFRTATAALQGAVDFVRALAEEPWPGGINLRSRASIHSGEAITEGHDYYGPTVNRCARIRSISHGAQILISGVTKSLVASEIPNDLSLKFLGSFRLKDIEQAEEIWQIVAEGLPTDFPNLRTWSEIPTNIEADLTSFVGREAQRLEIVNLLERRRMVTLTGTGGAGKTRLAIEVARSLQSNFPDGVWLIELADVLDGDQIARALQSSLKLPPGAAQGLPGLLATLRDRQMLVILDNCEHLLTDAANLAKELLRSCPEIKILATSREPVGASGEVTHRVPSLDLPSEKFRDLDEVAANESVALFLERARSHASNFALSEENAESVVHICRTLDGIPLALELAAARIRVLPPEELSRRLQDRFRILTRSKGGTPRHQTLRTTIEWSYKMLSELEREAFDQLSVFVGGWSMEMAERVCGDPIEEFELLDLLTALVDKSLVNFDSSDAGRYTFFDTIRQFAREQLSARPDVESAARERHARTMSNIGMERFHKLRTLNEPEALKDLVLNLSNLRAGLAWSRERGQIKLIASLCLAIGACYQRRGYPRDGVGPIDEALSLGPELAEIAPQLKAMLNCERAALALDLLDNDLAEPLATEARAIALSLGNDDLAIQAENLLGQVMLASEDFAQSRRFYQEALLRSEKSKNWVEIARLLNNLGIVERRDPDGDKELAAKHYRAALALQRTYHHSRGEAETLNSLGVLEQSRGNFAEAASDYLDAALLEHKLDHAFGVAKTLSNYAEALAEMGDVKRALMPFGIAEHLFAQIRSPYREYTADALSQAAAKLGWSNQQIEDFRDSCGRVHFADAVTASLQAG